MPVVKRSPHPSNSDDLIDFYPASREAKPPRLCCRYVRHMVLPNVRNPGPMSGPPFTWVLAQQVRQDMRDVYFVRLDLPHQDGLHLAYRHQPFRFGCGVLDSDSLGPYANYRRHNRVTQEERAYFKHWAAYYKAEWEKWASRFPIDSIKTRFERAIDWLMRRKESPIAVMYRSETEMRWFHQWYDTGDKSHLYPIIKQAIIRPTKLNNIHENLFGEHRRVWGFVHVSAHEQTLAGIANTQRVFYLPCDYDGKRPCFSRLDNLEGWIKTSTIYPGAPAESADGDQVLFDGAHSGWSHMRYVAQDWREKIDKRNGVTRLPQPEPAPQPDAELKVDPEPPKAEPEAPKPEPQPAPRKRTAEPEIQYVSGRYAYTVLGRSFFYDANDSASQRQALADAQEFANERHRPMAD